jgi:hypothetical protein
MIRAITAFAVMLCVVLSMPNVAAAKHRHSHASVEHSHKRHHRPVYAPVRGDIAATCDERYCNFPTQGASTERSFTRRGVQYTYDDGQVIGGRPSGCPHAFCGCEASIYKFGRIIPALNLAYNWIRKFPRTSPAPGMAAARSGHVMILISFVGGSEWLVHDGNSGRHLTREHVRSIAGYVIVNPNAQLASK